LPASQPAPDHRRTIAGAIVGAAALALIGTGVYFSLQATDDSNQVTHFFQSGGRWDDHWRSVEASGRTATVTSAALYSVGGAAAISSAALLLVDWKRHREWQSNHDWKPVTVTVSQSDLVATWALDF
jgi:hypothetical protein